MYSKRNYMTNLFFLNDVTDVLFSLLTAESVGCRVGDTGGKGWSEVLLSEAVFLFVLGASMFPYSQGFKLKVQLYRFVRECCS